MHCVVTAGPTYEPLDKVRRLTNFSTGQLGSELAGFFAVRGHKVTLLLGEQATFRGALRAQTIARFGTAADLEERLRVAGTRAKIVVFHAAAVSDFTFGKVWLRSEQNELTEIKAGKISSRRGSLLAELVPNSKIIARLRDWFPAARLVGWKFEVDGDRARVIDLARAQLAECRTDACVANGPAYGPGFGLVRPSGEVVHVEDQSALFEALLKFVQTPFES